MADSLMVTVLTIYFLADLPRIRALGYRFVPHARRPRAILIGEDILNKIGGYVLGNVVISVIAAALTFTWLVSFGVPYPFLLAVLVALLDLVPVVGSTIAGIIVVLVALTVSLPVCLFTIGFFVVYRFFEDYVLVPKLIGKAVEVPALLHRGRGPHRRRPARRRRRGCGAHWCTGRLQRHLVGGPRSSTSRSTRRQGLVVGVDDHRNTVERAINRLRGYRAVATRYDKREFVYKGTIDVASIGIWLR